MINNVEALLLGSFERTTFSSSIKIHCSTAGLLESYVSNHGKEIGTVARIFVVKGDENSKEIGLLENGGDTLKREILTVYSQNDLLLISVEQDQYGSAVIDQLLESEVKFPI